MVALPLNKYRDSLLGIHNGMDIVGGGAYVGLSKSCVNV